jgi:hypothetical protein
MKALNKFLIVLLLLGLIALAGAVLIFPEVVLPAVGEWLIDLGEQVLRLKLWFRRLAGILIFVIIAALALFLIYLEVRPRRKRYIRVQAVSGGMATISIESVEQQLEYRLDPIPHVINASPIVRAKRNKVQARVDVTVDPAGNVPSMASKLMENVREVLTEEMGLQVFGEPQVRMTVARTPEGRGRRERRRTPPPTPPAKEEVQLEPEPLEETEPPEELVEESEPVYNPMEWDEEPELGSEPEFGTEDEEEYEG